MGPWLERVCSATSYFSAVISGLRRSVWLVSSARPPRDRIGNAIPKLCCLWCCLRISKREMTRTPGRVHEMPESPARGSSRFISRPRPSSRVLNCVNIGMAVITRVYVVLGGYMATVMNDFIQGIVMLLGHAGRHRGGVGEYGGFYRGYRHAVVIPVTRIPRWCFLSASSIRNLPDHRRHRADQFGTWGLPQMVFYAIKSVPVIASRGAINLHRVRDGGGRRQLLPGGSAACTGDQVRHRCRQPEKYSYHAHHAVHAARPARHRDRVSAERVHVHALSSRC